VGAASRQPARHPYPATADATPHVSQALALRSRIVLGYAGWSNQAVAVHVAEKVRPSTMGKWRRRFAADRLEGLCDAPRPGAVRTVADETFEKVLVDRLESTQGADTHWSTRGLAKKHGISNTTVAEIWRAFGLKPWQRDSFEVSPIPTWSKRSGTWWACT
jgi:transposase